MVMTRGKREVGEREDCYITPPSVTRVGGTIISGAVSAEVKSPTVKVRLPAMEVR